MERFAGEPAAPARDAPAPRISIVIPAFDEAERIEAALRRIAQHLGAERGTAEVLVVDDGSRDGTGACAEQAGHELDLRLRVLRHTPNRGKGYAVRRGMLEARGAAVLFTDADLSVPIRHLDAFWRRLQAGADVVFGSRHAAGAVIAVRQPAFRERLGDVFRHLARHAVVPDVADFTCGFKLFRREAAREVFSRQRLSGWGFDVEVALIARRLGLRLVEEPVEWRDDARTRVRLGRDVLRSAADLARIRWNDLRGCYAPAQGAGLGCETPQPPRGVGP